MPKEKLQFISNGATVDLKVSSEIEKVIFESIDKTKARRVHMRATRVLDAFGNPIRARWICRHDDQVHPIQGLEKYMVSKTVLRCCEEGAQIV